MSLDILRGNSAENFSSSYRSLVLARIPLFFAARGASVSGSGIGDRREFENYLSDLLPDLAITLHARSPAIEIHRVQSGELVNTHKGGGEQWLSSGEAQTLILALDIATLAGIWYFEGQPSRLVLIDEPDAHMHPDLQVRFADFLTRISRRYDVQFVVATHSVTLLSALGQFGGDSTGIIYMTLGSANFSTRQFNPVLKETAACLGGHVLMGALFGAPLMLLEGDDDYRIWSQVPRHHQVTLAAIPCNGEEIRRYQRTLEQIFASLQEPGERPVGFALLDGDKPLPIPNPDSPQRFIRYIQLACHESENLYLTDEVLADLGLTWTEASERIVAQAENFGRKQALLQTAKTWDRKSVDIKPVIRELELILDVHRMHWTTRVGSVIGRKRPEGQLLDFLGLEVVASLWT